MAPRAEVSIPIALATGTIVYTIYNRGLPASADMRVGKPGDETIETIRKQNGWMAAATVAGISLLTKDHTVFIIGGSMVIFLDWTTRINNWSNPLSNRVDLNPFTVEKPSDIVAGTPDAAIDYNLQAVP